MLHEDIADRIAAAYPGPELDDLVRNAWNHHTHGRLTIADMEVLDEAARTRREAFQARQPAGGTKPSDGTRNAPRTAPRRPRPHRQRSPDRQASIERRRAQSTEMPRPLRAMYTEGEAATLAVIGQEIQKHGHCDRSVGEIAARAGVSCRLVQNACRLAEQLGHITLRQRRLSAFRNDTNVIHIASAEWLTWLKIGGRTAKGVGENRFTARRAGLRTTQVSGFGYRRKEGKRLGEGRGDTS